MATTTTEDTYDDACDLGQFLMNPTWFLWVKLRGLFTSKASGRGDGKQSAVSNKSTCFNSVPHQRQLYTSFLFFGWTGVFVLVYPLMKKSETIDDQHMTYGYFVFFACLLSWLYASVKQVGVITDGNLAKYANYKYDHNIYLPSDVIHLPNTSSRPRIPRSKYCNYTQQHISRYDHYCGWLQRPVGEENYRAFLCFVVIHTIMCSYGSIVVGVVMSEGGGTISLMMLLLLLSAASICLVGFLGFHIKLILSNQTTHEYYKRKRMMNGMTEDVDNVCGGGASIEYNNGDAESGGSSAVASTTAIHTPANNNTYNHFYDLGVVGNVLEVLFPRSIYGDRASNMTTTIKTWTTSTSILKGD